ncbi:MAG: site-specific DNA-methyltransferase [Tolypothrix carrinoi HA7290-LM1]|jgi:site-specific DNA-methyltransferase (adenine-specific)|nr:site-specific DNA-methyltransferase [Tolypothrix carrinoi HA7290-LM1]
MKLAINKIHLGDARDLLAKVELNSIACSVWSPPYFVGKQYEKYLSYEEWISLLRAVIRHHQFLLKPGGFLVINIADILCFADESMPRIQAQNIRRQRCTVTREDVLQAKAHHPDYNRYDLAKLLGCSEQTIDRRLNGNNIRGGKYNTQTRVHLVGSIIESAATEAGLYLYDRRVWVKDAAWENSKWHTLSYRSVDEFEYLYFFWKPGETVVDRHRLTPDEWVEWGSRGVWNIPSVRANNDHEAKFPIELPRRIIKLLTDPGDIVLDCFMGSGSSAVAAIREKRNYIGIELEPKYVEIATRSCVQESEKMALFAQSNINKGSQPNEHTAIQLNGHKQLSLLNEV